ncbi:MAG: coniferyl aldehyde dehydrogenase [Burkholderiales bacterium]|nr:coniferyl aldehyde dehydrogenase [Burkholderiales bacterium]
MDLSQPNIDIPAALHDAFAAARRAYESSRMPSAAERRQSLTRLEQLLVNHREAIEAAISSDFGNRSRHETQLLEVFPALGTVRDARKHVARWMKPARAWASLWFLPARTEIRPQPLGVVGIIVPWNYPVLLAVAPLAAALAAGNRVLVKMSELTPQTSALFARLVSEHFAADQVTVVTGGADVAQEFSRLPFDHLLFTGSTAVGRQVMQAAAEHLTPVTLELGGKSPAIIGPECRIDEAADKILFGKCLNAGQTCIAPDYVLLPRAQEQAFGVAAQRAVARLYPTLAGNRDYTSIINERHLARLRGYMQDAAARGASLLPLSAAGESLEGSGKIAPTLVANVNDSMRLMQEEIFGPLLPLVPYDSLDEAIRYVNARPRPLALYYFGNFDDHIQRVLNETVAGGVSVNETLMHISQESLPFGGVGPSGMGAYHGRFGFETFSKMKPVFHQSSLNGLHLFKPPFGKRFESLIRFLLR